MAALARIIEHHSWWSHKPQTGPTPRPLSVRISRPDEEEKIFRVLMQMAEEIALAPVNETKVRAMIRRCSGPAAGEVRDGVIGLIDAPGGKIAATVGMIHNQWWYTNSWHVEEVWSFVHPDHRPDHRREENGPNYARALIQFSRWWGEQLGCPVLMGVMSTERTLGKIRLYAREIPLVGALFLHRGA